MKDETLEQWLERTKEARQKACAAEARAVRKQQKQAAKAAAWWAAFKARQGK